MYNDITYPNYQYMSNPYNSSYYTYPESRQVIARNISNQNDERLIGAGLVAPFLLGGITGVALAPYFYRPYYPYQPYPYPPYYPYPRY